MVRKDGSCKGNVDADLVLQAVIDYYKNNYTKVVIVTSDGDYYSLVDFLYKNERLGAVISSHKETCSFWLRRSAKNRLVFTNNLDRKLSYKKKSTV